MLEAEIAALNAALNERETQIQALRQELKTAVEQRRVAVKRSQEADRALEREVRALDKLIQETEWQRNLMDERGQERERLQATRARLEAECAETQTALSEAEAQLVTLSGELSALADDETARSAAEHRTQVALLSQEHGNRRVLLETRQREARRLQTQIASHEQRIRTFGSELTELDGAFGDAPEQLW